MEIVCLVPSEITYVVPWYEFSHYDSIMGPLLEISKPNKYVCRVISGANKIKLRYTCNYTLKVVCKQPHVISVKINTL